MTEPTGGFGDGELLRTGDLGRCTARLVHSGDQNLHHEVLVDRLHRPTSWQYRAAQDWKR